MNLCIAPIIWIIYGIVILAIFLTLNVGLLGESIDLDRLTELKILRDHRFENPDAGIQAVVLEYPYTAPVLDHIHNNGWKIGSMEGAPTPYGLLGNCESLNADIAQMVRVDDTISGILEATNIGAWSVYVHDTSSADAHYTIAHIRELPAVLDQIDKLIKAGFKPSDFESLSIRHLQQTLLDYPTGRST